jgi:hypothetical protein
VLRWYYQASFTPFFFFSLQNVYFAAGIILVELSFFVSPGTKFVTKRDIAWLLSLVNSDDIDEGVLLGVLKLIGGLCETNYGKARYRPLVSALMECTLADRKRVRSIRKWIRALDGVTALLKLICATDSQNAQWFAAHTLNGTYRHVHSRLTLRYLMWGVFRIVRRRFIAI